MSRKLLFIGLSLLAAGSSGRADPFNPFRSLLESESSSAEATSEAPAPSSSGPADPTLPKAPPPSAPVKPAMSQNVPPEPSPTHRPTGSAEGTSVQVQAVVETEEGRYALLKQGDRHQWVQAGGIFAGWTVEALAPETVTLQQGERQLQLHPSSR